MFTNIAQLSSRNDAITGRLNDSSCLQFEVLWRPTYTTSLIKKLEFQSGLWTSFRLLLSTRRGEKWLPNVSQPIHNNWFLLIEIFLLVIKKYIRRNYLTFQKDKKNTTHGKWQFDSVQFSSIQFNSIQFN